MTSEINNVPIKLNSVSNEFRIPQETFMIPSNWKRFQLSQLINNVLSNQKSVPFDFFIGNDLNGEKLINTISNYSNGEEVLNLTYIPSILPPKHLSTYIHDDWISSVNINKNSNDLKFLTSSYDGLISVWNSSNKKLIELSGHNGSVLDSTWVENDKDDNFYIASAGHDSTVRLWKIPQNNEIKPNQLLNFHHHSSPVTSVTSAKGFMDNDPSNLLSSDSNGIICLWDTRIPTTHETELNDDEPSNKKRKKRNTINQDSILRKSPLHILRGHQGIITQSIFSKFDSTVGFSCGYDHTIRSWDLGLGVETNVKNSSSVIRTIENLSTPNIVVTGHADRIIGLWDIREQTTNVSQKLTGHTSHISQIKSHPTSQHHFSSSSLDGTIKIWDARAPKQSLFTIVRKPANGKSENENKILSIDWDGSVIGSGGEDCTLQLFDAKA